VEERGACTRLADGLFYSLVGQTSRCGEPHDEHVYCTMKEPTRPVLPAIRIRDVLDRDTRAASRELLKFGLTIVDDISGTLVDVVEEELFEHLGHAADCMDLHMTRVDTGWGPVYVFRDRSRVTLALAKKVVFAQRPKP